MCVEVDSDDEEPITVSVSIMSGERQEVILHGDRTFGKVTNELFSSCPGTPRGDGKYILAEAGKGNTDRFTDYSTIAEAANQAGRAKRERGCVLHVQYVAVAPSGHATEQAQFE